MSELFSTYFGALIFFFGIFWATILSSVSDYLLFVVRKSPKRLVTGIVILNIFPLVLLYILSKLNGIILDHLGLVTTISAALAALSVFSTIFFLQAILVAKLTSLGYEAEEKEFLKANFVLPNVSNVWKITRIGLLYLIGWPILAIIFSLIFR